MLVFFPDPQHYMSFIGVLQYATLTRPNIYTKVVILRFCPFTCHWFDIRRIPKYLSGIIKFVLSLLPNSLLKHIVTMTRKTMLMIVGPPQNSTLLLKINFLKYFFF